MNPYWKNQWESLIGQGPKTKEEAEQKADQMEAIALETSYAAMFKNEIRVRKARKFGSRGEGVLGKTWSVVVLHEMAEDTEELVAKANNYMEEATRIRKKWGLSTKQKNPMTHKAKELKRKFELLRRGDTEAGSSSFCKGCTNRN